MLHKLEEIEKRRCMEEEEIEESEKNHRDKHVSNNFEQADQDVIKEEPLEEEEIDETDTIRPSAQPFSPLPPPFSNINSNDHSDSADASKHQNESNLKRND